MSAGEILNEIDRAGSEAAHYTNVYRHRRDELSLLEMRRAISILQALTDELTYLHS